MAAKPEVTCEFSALRYGTFDERRRCATTRNHGIVKPGPRTDWNSEPVLPLIQAVATMAQTRCPGGYPSPAQVNPPARFSRP
jgi:hypothetical protein